LTARWPWNILRALQAGDIISGLSRGTILERVAPGEAMVQPRFETRQRGFMNRAPVMFMDARSRTWTRPPSENRRKAYGIRNIRRKGSRNTVSLRMD